MIKFEEAIVKGTWMMDIITQSSDGTMVEYTVVKYNMNLLEAFRGWHCGDCQDCLYEDATFITEATPDDKWYETWSSCKKDVEEWLNMQITEDWYMNHTSDNIDESEDCVRAYRI